MLVFIEEVLLGVPFCVEMPDDLPPDTFDVWGTKLFAINPDKSLIELPVEALEWLAVTSRTISAKSAYTLAAVLAGSS